MLQVFLLTAALLSFAICWLFGANFGRVAQLEDRDAAVASLSFSAGAFVMACALIGAAVFA